MPPMTDDHALLQSLAELARRAGAEVMRVYAAGFEARRKADASPVTEADLRAEAVIVDALAHLAPQWPVVAEEAVAGGAAPRVEPGGCWWLVDPLDGTREFVQRNGEFTVNIALVEAGRPRLGVVFAPAVGGPDGLLWAGAQGLGAWCEDASGRRAIACREPSPLGLDVLASRSHDDPAALQAFLAGYRVRSLASAGSSLKLCRIAQGLADLYPRLGRTMEWDIAAGHAVLAAAGGGVRTLDGQPLAYGKPGFENPSFVATGRA